MSLAITEGSSVWVDISNDGIGGCSVCVEIVTDAVVVGGVSTVSVIVESRE